MSSWLQWSVLTLLTGSPLLSLLIVAALWFAADRFTLQLLPDPLKAWTRYQRVSRLQRRIHHNPHDRPARRELADLYVQQRRYAAAVDVIRANLEAGDDDGATLLLAGAGAKEVLGRYCAARPGTIEGKVLLARACQRLGDLPKAVDMKRAAWADYVAAPAFQRRRERFWAWRANPSRPILYAGILAIVLIVCVGWVLPAAARAASQSNPIPPSQSWDMVE